MRSRSFGCTQHSRTRRSPRSRACGMSAPINMKGLRIDKWLWAARFFKTRSLAARACELGRIESGGERVKASREVRLGDFLLVKNDSGDFHVEVLGLSESRGPASVATTLYRETEASRALRAQLAANRKVMRDVEGEREGKPSKRDR